nr:uncharacterized protein CI109_005153 [Kwoniella shandongensis]KAA5526577.1 hypothetical protein CI109_005153 [Kwoniella shandongensis]
MPSGSSSKTTSQSGAKSGSKSGDKRSKLVRSITSSSIGSFGSNKSSSSRVFQGELDLFDEESFVDKWKIGDYEYPNYPESITKKHRHAFDAFIDAATDQSTNDLRRDLMIQGVKRLTKEGMWGSKHLDGKTEPTNVRGLTFLPSKGYIEFLVDTKRLTDRYAERINEVLDTVVKEIDTVRASEQRAATFSGVDPWGFPDPGQGSGY